MTRPRHRTPLTMVIALALAIPLVVLGTRPADAQRDLGVRGEPAGCSLDDSCTVRIGSYNIEANRSFDEFKTAVRKFKPKVDVAGLQEIAGHVKNNWLDSQSGWETYHAPHLGQIPVVWNPEVFEYVSGDEYLLAPGRRIEGKYGGLVFKKDTYAPAVRLLHLETGRLFSIINVHLINGAMNLGAPDPRKPLTYALYLQQVASMMAAVESERAAGFTPVVTGDYNVSYAQDAAKRIVGQPYASFTAAGMASIWKGRTLSPHGTHIDTTCRPGVRVCGAYLDGVWADRDMKVTEARVFRRIVHSDHYPLMGRFRVPVVDLP